MTTTFIGASEFLLALCCSFVGQAYIKNNSKTNSSFEKEQEYYHQGVTPDDKKPVPLFSLEWAKELMRFDHWYGEAMAWGELKETLGHFSASADRTRYIRRMTKILEEIAKQVLDLQAPEQIVAVAKSEAFAEFFERVLTRWDEIRSVKGYVRASMENILIKTPESILPSPSALPRPQ